MIKPKKFVKIACTYVLTIYFFKLQKTYNDLAENLENRREKNKNQTEFQQMEMSIPCCCFYINLFILIGC